MKREYILSKDYELNSQEEKLEEALLKNDKLSEDIEDYANLVRDSYTAICIARFV